jgi:hypothetical protein
MIVNGFRAKDQKDSPKAVALRQRSMNSIENIIEKIASMIAKVSCSVSKESTVESTAMKHDTQMQERRTMFKSFAEEKEFVSYRMRYVIF